jgi:hypothetical protein
MQTPLLLVLLAVITTAQVSTKLLYPQPIWTQPYIDTISNARGQYLFFVTKTSTNKTIVRSDGSLPGTSSGITTPYNYVYIKPYDESHVIVCSDFKTSQNNLMVTDTFSKIEYQIKLTYNLTMMNARQVDGYLLIGTGDSSLSSNFREFYLFNTLTNETTFLRRLEYRTYSEPRIMVQDNYLISIPSYIWKSSTVQIVNPVTKAITSQRLKDFEGYTIGGYYTLGSGKLLISTLNYYGGYYTFFRYNQAHGNFSLSVDFPMKEISTRSFLSAPTQNQPDRAFVYWTHDFSKPTQYVDYYVCDFAVDSCKKGKLPQGLLGGYPSYAKEIEKVFFIMLTFNPNVTMLYATDGVDHEQVVQLQYSFPVIDKTGRGVFEKFAYHHESGYLFFIAAEYGQRSGLGVCFRRVLMALDVKRKVVQQIVSMCEDKQGDCSNFGSFYLLRDHIVVEIGNQRDGIYMHQLLLNM